MDYWHIQMHLPEGKGKPEIDSSQMLKEPKPVIGTGEWDDKQCRDFKGENGGLSIDSIVMVRKGNEPLALCKIISAPFTDDDLEIKYLHENYRYVKILAFNTEERTSSLFSQGTLKVLYESRDTASWNYINDWYKKVTQMADINNCIDILKYKKQIVLQGPPGTGKTKLAKEIAKQLIVPPNISESDVKSILAVGLKIKSVTDYTSYTITSIGDVYVTVGLESSTNEYKPSYKEITNAFAIKMWEGGQTKGNDPYAAAIAKYVFQNIGSDQFQIIQFHPSYSYEDFVRGIVSKPNQDGEGILYEAENRIFVKFAKEAFENFQLSKSNKEVSMKIIETKTNFQKFIDHVQEIIDTNENHKYFLTENVYIFDIDESRFKYKGDNWEAHPKGSRMKFSELEKLINLNLFSRAEIKKNAGLNGLTRQHATYFTKLLEKYQQFIKDNPVQVKEKPILKNFVLIIDEINRANLSSVLGELIYALEYRGEEVDSMYEVDGSKKLILPSNLYIIGTMNTADRSVGNIDYAIRRRFAFVEVLPNDLTFELGDKFHKSLFEKVSSFFNHETNLSREFESKDIQLGHSYFIDKSDEGGTMEIRLQYEIKPILLEYVKDGILIGEGIESMIKGLNV